MRTFSSACVGALVGLLLACSSSSTTKTDERTNDPQTPSICPSCSSLPTASSSASSSAPVCSVWSPPSSFAGGYNWCTRVPEQDNSCRNTCSGRGLAWKCPQDLAYNITCFRQDDHWCCADMWCGLFESDIVQWCEGGLFSYACRQGPTFDEVTFTPPDMGCSIEDHQKPVYSCCPFRAQPVDLTAPNP
jgi:hypothetical protein